MYNIDSISPQLSKSSAQGPISSLPVELLRKIIGFVYGANCQQRYFSLEAELDSEWVEVKPTSPSLFPYAVASVCTWWRDIMALIPEYWTRIVVIIDAPSPSPISVESCFQWSQNLPLNVYVTRSNPLPLNYCLSEPDRQRELAQVTLVMNSLRSNVLRCKKIHFDVVHSSSLPSIPEDFHGTAPYLRELELICHVDDDESPGRYEMDTARKWDFYCPELSDLALNGANFAASLQLLGSPKTLDSLKVGHYKAAHHLQWPLHLRDVCSVLLRNPQMRLHSLAFEDVEFEVDDAPLPYDHPPLFVKSFDFHSIKSDDITRILRFVQWTTFTTQINFTQCPVGELSIPLRPGRLRFKEIAVDQDLSVPLRKWVGDVLYVSASPCFDDKLLYQLGGGGSPLYIPRSGGGDPHRQFVCPLGKLYLDGCTNFSVAALKQMIKGRLEARFLDRWSLERIIVYPIVQLTVSGGPPLRIEDREWLDANVQHFIWEP
ncbi:hypothetical protein BJ138DRAFT_749699 [Hygrophoropsis aurantiaca]|uniref:Uncharacterized protein n=1 Tax=Hygrophoropsis aurantiaca TaxID=72124 RepID=A0ACB8AHE0_9AGAM|nr:hypothetical protein BJ138DRAFT_749699 [Hygrophoropsis aurantiaca]